MTNCRVKAGWQLHACTTLRTTSSDVDHWIKLFLPYEWEVKQMVMASRGSLALHPKPSWSQNRGAELTPDVWNKDVQRESNKWYFTIVKEMLAIKEWNISQYLKWQHTFRNILWNTSIDSTRKVKMISLPQTVHLYTYFNSTGWQWTIWVHVISKVDQGELHEHVKKPNKQTNSF